MDKSTVRETAMPSLSYYRDIDRPSCDTRSDAEPLRLNCVGYYTNTKPFQTHNVRGRQDFYLQYVAQGQLCVHSFGEPRTFSRGMYTIYRPHTAYRYELLPSESIGYYWAHFTGFHAERMLAGLGLETECICRTDGSEAGRKRILHSFTRLFDEFTTRRPGFDDACAAQLTAILVELTRGADQASVGPVRRLASVAYLHSHYQEDTRIADLAAMEHLSESRYREVFRRHTGYSPLDYRTALRLQHACDLLTETESTVTEIAAECGYADVLYFLRVFKQKKGMTPVEYRRTSRRGGV